MYHNLAAIDFTFCRWIFVGDQMINLISADSGRDESGVFIERALITRSNAITTVRLPAGDSRITEIKAEPRSRPIKYMFIGPSTWASKYKRGN